MTEGSRHTLPVSEVFGATFQGEGPYAGRLAAFVRLGGCNLTCTWCFAPNTPVLMADWTEKPISDVRIGDLVASFRNRRYEVARVENTLTRTVDERVTVIYGDREVVTTPDHVFANPHHIDGRRRSKASELEGRHLRVSALEGWEPDNLIRTDDWWTGWLQGVVLGDGHVGQSAAHPHTKVWLRVCDEQLASAYSREVNRRGARTTVREQARRTSAGNVVYSVVHTLSKVPEVVGLPDTPDEIAGFLAGFLDAEGHVSRNQIAMSQDDDKTLERVAKMLAHLGIPSTLTPTGTHVGHVTVNGKRNVDRFMRITRPVLDRKRTSHRRPEQMLTSVAVEAVKETTGGEVVNLTTSSGFFFANGALVEQCDTPYTWDASRFDLRTEITRQPNTAILDQLNSIDAPLVVVSGGEPLLHQRHEAFTNLLIALQKADYTVHVETNGTIAPTPATRTLIDHFTVSPKLGNSGVEMMKRIRPDALTAFTTLARDGQAVFKFVAAEPRDLDEIQALTDAYNIPPDSVWVMGEGVTPDTTLDHTRAIADAVIAHRWNLATRLHTLIWGDTRGT